MFPIPRDDPNSPNAVRPLKFSSLPPRFLNQSFIINSWSTPLHYPIDAGIVRIGRYINCWSTAANIREHCLQCLTVRDTYRECLEKDPNDRMEEDIETLLEFMQHLPAFANMTLSVRRELCAVMVFAVVEKAGTVVMNHGEELDSWSVIVNGMVEVELPDGTIQDLYLGDRYAFG